MSDTTAAAALIRTARPDEMDVLRQLFREYEAWLQVDLCFQGFEQELAALPGAYGPPQGGIWLCERDGEVAGCVALRPLDQGRCEIKRLWVREAYRGQSLGRRLAETALREGKAKGYARVCLDTLGQMTEARQLYNSLGFHEIPAYYDNPLVDVRYFEREL